ncbi:MAG: Asp-tRNA(Asn)/Glu-tRNA(Gln) amidotransferase subunit GatC [Puniceicoccales bacterium]|nr:Asp-tRNA(Asn)/Glu-tRNA(Gln) amidotransferase subunit GatC [Puniceicoccales bacterium]
MEQPIPIDINLVSSLARIELTEEESHKFASQLGNILEYLGQIKKVDVTDVEPMAHAFPIYNVWRDDVPGENFPVNKVLMNAPEKFNDQIIVPKIIE